MTTTSSAVPAPKIAIWHVKIVAVVPPLRDRLSVISIPGKAVKVFENLLKRDGFKVKHCRGGVASRNVVLKSLVWCLAESLSSDECRRLHWKKEM